MLVSSHVLAEIEQIADHIAVITGGRLVHEGALSELVAGGSDLEQAYLDLTRSTQKEAVR